MKRACFLIGAELHSDHDQPNTEPLLEGHVLPGAGNAQGSCEPDMEDATPVFLDAIGLIAAGALGISFFLYSILFLIDLIRGVDNVIDSVLYGPFDRPDDRR